MRKLLTWIVAGLLLPAYAQWAAASPQNSAPAAQPATAQPSAGQPSSAQAQPGPAPRAPIQPSPPPEAVQANATMQTFTSQEGRFSVLLPGTPQQKSQQIALQGGASSTLHQFWVELQGGKVTYMVMYNDYPPQVTSQGAQAVLAKVRDGAAKGKTLTSDASIEVNGVPGRAFTLTDSNGWNYSIHQFLAGQRLYQLIVVSNKAHPAQLTDQFMNSFRIR